MTVVLDEYYDVTVHHAEKVGPRRWRAKGDIHRRDTFETLAIVYGEGGAMTSADRRAIEEARRRVAFLGIPEGWKNRK